MELDFFRLHIFVYRFGRLIGARIRTDGRRREKENREDTIVNTLSSMIKLVIKSHRFIYCNCLIAKWPGFLSLAARLAGEKEASRD